MDVGIGGDVATEEQAGPSKANGTVVEATEEPDSGAGPSMAVEERFSGLRIVTRGFATRGVDRGAGPSMASGDQGAGPSMASGD